MNTISLFFIAVVVIVNVAMLLYVAYKFYKNTKDDGRT